MCKKIGFGHVRIKSETVDVVIQTFLDVLFDWVHFFLGGDFHFGIGPSWDFNNHVVDLISCLPWDVMERTMKKNVISRIPKQY